MAITVTEGAASEIKRYMESQNVAEGTVLRMSVAGGGCSGLKYALGFAADYEPGIDACYQHHGVSLVTRKKMALFLDGTTIDFLDGPTGRGFTIDNPSVPKGGGCPGCGHH